MKFNISFENQPFTKSSGFTFRIFQSCSSKVWPRISKIMVSKLSHDLGVILMLMKSQSMSWFIFDD